MANKPSLHFEGLFRRLIQDPQTWSSTWVAGLMGHKPAHCLQVGMGQATAWYVTRLQTVD